MIFFPNYASRAEPEGAVHVMMEDGVRLSAVFLPNVNAKLTLVALPWKRGGAG